MRPRIVVLDEEFGWPLSSGKRIRCWQLLSRFADGFRITFVAHPNPDRAELPAALEAFRGAGIEPVVVERPAPVKHGPSFAWSLLRNLASPLPWSVANHASPEMLAKLREIVRDDRPALIHCEWSPFAQVVCMLADSGHPVPPVPSIINAQNVEYRIWQRLADTQTNPLKRRYLRLQASRFQRFEREAYRLASRVLAVSREDADIIRDAFGVSAHVVENGVEPDYFTPDPKVIRKPCEWLFLGSLDWLANRDAVDWLLDEIVPLAAKAIPGFTLVVAGRKPPDSMRERIAATAGVRLVADAPDIRPLLRESTGLIVPLRIGGGSRLKILEALACRTPVLSTTIGAEGLDLVPGQHLSIADDPAGMIEAIRRHVADPAAAARLADEGYERVLAQYGWKELSAKLGRHWQEMIAQAGGGGV